MSKFYLLHAVGDAGAGVWGIGGSRVLRVCRHDVLTPQSTAEGGGESVKDRARGQAQARFRSFPSRGGFKVG